MAAYAYYCLHKLHILPNIFLKLDQREKAFIIASIKVKVEKEEKERKKAERKGRR